MPCGHRYPQHCTHDPEGKIEQHILDAEDGVAAERALQGKGSPTGAQDLIDDDGEIVEFAAPFNEVEGDNVIAGLDRVPTQSGKIEVDNIGAKPVHATMSDLGSGVAQSYINKVRNGAGLHSYFASAGMQPGPASRLRLQQDADYYALLTPQLLLHEMVQVGHNQGRVKIAVDCVDHKIKENSLSAVAAYADCQEQLQSADGVLASCQSPFTDSSSATIASYLDHPTQSGKIRFGSRRLLKGGRSKPTGQKTAGHNTTGHKTAGHTTRTSDLNKTSTY
jgi:hypothetical protein